MDVEPTKSREMRDQDLNEALDARPGVELDGLSMPIRRLARIQEYEEAMMRSMQQLTK